LLRCNRWKLIASPYNSASIPDILFYEFVKVDNSFCEIGDITDERLPTKLHIKVLIPRMSRDILEITYPISPKNGSQ